MHVLKKIYLGITIVGLVSSCVSKTVSEKTTTYCGIQTDEIELDLTTENPYDHPKGSKAFGAINDSIREHMSDSVEFEIFLAGMSEDAIAIYIYAPKSKEYMNTIGCAIMDTEYPDFVPNQRYMLYYSYMDDPEAIMPLEISIKRK